MSTLASRSGVIGWLAYHLSELGVMTATNSRQPSMLSIVICNYNYAAYLETAIRSAVEQAHCPTEVIVVDDGSTDGSREIIARWSDRVKVILRDNGGQVSAYNAGFEASHGDVVIFLDSDDSLDLDAGQRVLAAFEDPNVVKVHYFLRLINVHGTPLGPVIPHQLSTGNVSAKLKNHGVFYFSSPGSGNAYRRDALARLMPLPESEEDRHGADFFAVLGICLLGDIASLGNEPAASYRIHSKDATFGLHFGNAGTLKEPQKTQSRYARLRKWVRSRLGPAYELPVHPVDFSIEKHTFSELVFAENYWSGVRGGGQFLRNSLLRSIWARSTPLWDRVGLTGWALAVVLLPRPAALPIARYVCNPASRTA